MSDIIENFNDKKYELVMNDIRDTTKAININELLKMYKYEYKFQCMNIKNRGDFRNYLKFRIMSIIAKYDDAFSINFEKIMDVLGAEKHLNVIDICIYDHIKRLLKYNALTDEMKIIILDSEFRKLNEHILELIIDSMDDPNLSLNGSNGGKKNEDFDPFYNFFTDIASNHSMGYHTDFNYYFLRLELFFKYSSKFNLCKIYNNSNGSFLNLVYHDCYYYDENEDIKKGSEKAMDKFNNLMNKYSISRKIINES